MTNSSTTDRDWEVYKNNQELAQSAHKENEEFVNFANKSALDLSAHAIKALILINGGAAVAMLSFAAAVTSKGNALNLDIHAIVNGLTWFAAGTGSAAFCALLAYVVMYMQAAEASQVKYIWEHPYIENKPKRKTLRRIHAVVHISAVVAAIASFVCFSLGVWDVSQVALKAATS